VAEIKISATHVLNEDYFASFGFWILLRVSFILRSSSLVKDRFIIPIIDVARRTVKPPIIFIADRISIASPTEGAPLSTGVFSRSVYIKPSTHRLPSKEREISSKVSFKEYLPLGAVTSNQLRIAPFSFKI